MLTLHHLEYSQSFRILWLLEELNFEYDLQLYNRDPETVLAPAAFKAVSPLGTAPAITHGDIALSETNAIIDYILDLAPNHSLTPKIDDKNRPQHLFWYHASQASLMPLLMFGSIFRIASQRTPAFIGLFVKPVFSKINENFIAPRMKPILESAERDLSQAQWFGGDSLSTADIAMIYPMESAKARGLINSSHKNCLAWIERVHARPAFISAKEKDGREQMVLPL